MSATFTLGKKMYLFTILKTINQTSVSEMKLISGEALG
jgi:hypothetical protein